MQTVNFDEGNHLATVEFENQKRRGDVATHLGFMFSTDPKINYEERLASVERVDQDKLENIKITEEIKSDDEIITVAINCIKNGFNTKMRFRDTIAEQAGISRRKALKLIEKYEGSEPDKHKWNFTVHKHGTKIYYILEGGSEA